MAETKRSRYWSDRVLFPDAAEPAPGWVEVEGDRIVAVGTGESSEPAQVLDGLVAPGFVDVHSHGGGGASFVTEDPEVARQALAAHRRHGVTTMVASLVTGTVADLKRQVACLSQLVANGELAGIHLEGPWLALKYKGAHPPELLADPLPEVVAELLDAGNGAIRMVTIAPERTGAMDSIRLMAGRGVVAAIGHTDADYDTCKAAIEAGAIGATHLFNAMAPLRHRDPGPVLALWEDSRVYLELIADGVHVRPELIAFVAAVSTRRFAPAQPAIRESVSAQPAMRGEGAPAQPAMREGASAQPAVRGSASAQPAMGPRLVLVTDAMAAAGSDDGDYVLGELPVEVRDGVARIAGTDTIAGSTLILDRAVRNCVAAGIPLAEAVRAATATAADYLGLGDVGRLAPGKRADLIVLDDDLAVRGVLYRGEWLATVSQ